MANFAEVSASVPARYRDARSGLRFRVVDVTEDGPPAHVVTTEVGDGLLAALFWHHIGVTPDNLKTWSVSLDEAMATAGANIDDLDTKTITRDADGAPLRILGGHPWVSSLIVAESKKPSTDEGFLVAIPHASVLAITPVVGAETVRGLEVLMSLCEALYNVDETGVSPFVWWWFQGNYYRVTDRTEDGSIDFLEVTNLYSFTLVRAMEHLTNPCAECGRD